MGETEPRVGLKQFLAAGRVAPDQWLIRGGPQRQWLVHGPPWLDRLFQALGDGFSMAALTAQLADVAPPPDVRRTVHELLDAGALEHVADRPPGAVGGTDPLEAYLSRWNISAAQSRMVRAGCRVGVAASGLLARDLHAVLASSGLNAMVVPLDELEHEARAFTLLVGAADDPDETSRDAVARVAQQHGIPWLHLSTDAETAWLGPLFIPHETACWRCLQHRLNSNRRHHDLYERFLAARRAAGADPRMPPAPLFIRQAVAGLAALEVLRFLFAHEPPQCVGHVVLVRLRDLQTVREAVLQIPGCPVCAAAPARERLTLTATASQPTTDRPPAARRFGDLLVGRHCGIVQRVCAIPRRWDDPDVYVVGVELADATALGPAAVVSRAGGVGLTYDDAWCGAIGEAAERYSATLAPAQLPSREGAWADFGPGEAVDPAALALFSDAQYGQAGFPVRPFHRDTRTVWLAGWRLTPALDAARSPYWMPADCVGLCCQHSGPDKLITVPTSTGLAAGQTLLRGLLAGVCEVIERDAFIVAWFNNLSAPRVDLHARQLAWLRELLESRLLWPRIEYHVADLTTDVGVPVYAAISRGPSEDGTIASFGAAWHPCARLALTKALLEAAAGRVCVRQRVRSQPRRAYRRDFADVCSFADHAQFYTRHPRHWPHLRGLVSTRRLANLDALALPPGDDEASLARIVTQLAALALPACWCDLTTPDVAAAGLHVVRVLVPGMQPLHGDHRLPFLGGQRHADPERVFAWARRAGQRRPSRRMPHPFP
jgi:ribosomal protein S12 methylthiotransferase accessory factor